MFSCYCKKDIESYSLAGLNAKKLKYEKERVENFHSAFAMFCIAMFFIVIRFVFSTDEAVSSMLNVLILGVFIASICVFFNYMAAKRYIELYQKHIDGLQARIEKEESSLIDKICNLDTMTYSNFQDFRTNLLRRKSDLVKHQIKASASNC